MNSEERKGILSCVLKAVKDNDKLLFKIYRHVNDDCCEIYQLVPSSAEFEEFKYELKNEDDVYVPFEYPTEGCSDMVIISDEEEFFIWRKDNDSSNVWNREIARYLA